MNKFFSIVFISLFFPLVLSAQPKLQIVGGDTYNWGDQEVTPTSKGLKAEIKVKNIGNELLEISNVKATCGCTTAPIKKKKLEPGEETSIDVTLRVNNSGSVSKGIKIYSNDPESKMKYLRLKANIIKLLQISPGYFAFGEVQIGQKKTVSINISNNSDEDIEVFGFETDKKGFELSNIDKTIIKAKSKMKLDLMYTPSITGPINCSVFFKSNRKGYEKIMIPAYGRAIGSPIFNPKL